MNCNPTLTADEFKTVHNALWELDNSVRQLEEVIHPDMYVNLARAASTIRKGLEGAYAQDSEAFDRKHGHYDGVRKELGLKSIWSLYDVEDLSQPHPYPGDVFVVYKDHWGDQPVHCAVSGSTWAAVYTAADNCIIRSGDQHHVFIEGFELKNGNELHMSTGS
jgi:hypothetical protein